MVNEIEKAGFPIVHVANMSPVSQSLGVNRIITGYGIPYPYCNPALDEDVQREQRYKMVLKALDLLSTEIDKQTVLGYV